ncbi:hypothetical protein [Brevundimonas sp. Root1279]|uniref:hypothetical protein n=1 Tax=Brevundimonas sp. Root1279 TaxID=1736443 RepID=UPI0006FB2653|nr:hypothetical protein [Brevundimonas sp. Root1279]KQW79756.1 hypothetical protein ASC65_14510 [Brevundimonas sp. Root1279]
MTNQTAPCEGEAQAVVDEFVKEMRQRGYWDDCPEIAPHDVRRMLGDMEADLSAPTAPVAGVSVGEIMHRETMTVADLIRCARANAAAMHEGSNLAGLLEQMATALSAPTAPVGVDREVLERIRGDITDLRAEHEVMVGASDPSQWTIDVSVSDLEAILAALSASPQPGEGGSGEPACWISPKGLELLALGKPEVRALVQIGRDDDYAKPLYDHPASDSRDGALIDQITALLAIENPSHRIPGHARELLSRALAALSIVGGGGALRPAASVPTEPEAAGSSRQEAADG